MFHHMEKDTGEPPTIGDAIMSSSQESDSVFVQSSSANPDQIQNEADSGYEASPSSTNGVRTFSFDGKPGSESTTLSEGSVPAERAAAGGRFQLDDAFEDASHILMGYPTDDEDSPGEVEDEDTDFEDLDFGSPICCSVDDRSPNSEADTENSRPSSSPIPIPLDSVPRLRPASAGNLGARRPAEPSPTSLLVPVLSAHQTRVQQPRSWPVNFRYNSIVLPAVRLRCDVSPSHLLCRFGLPSAASSSASASTSRTRNRRRLIDSDASSASSSDEGSEVFDSAETVPSVQRFGALSHSYQLPDVVPDLPQSALAPNGVRRSRSISVNLPLDRHQQEVVRNIGRRLRMLSDRFAHQMNSRRTSTPRRNTIGEIVRSTLESLERRRHRDDDYDGLGGSLFPSHTTTRHS